jgi:cobalt-zinc-cadmium efflux system protein
MAFLDPLASLLIGALILWNAWGILRESVEILLESTPHDVDVQAMVGDLMRVNGVRGVHDLHVWSITHNMRALSAHILTDDVLLSTGTAVQRDINELLSRKYGIAHAALQLECAGCEPDLLYCDMVAANNHTHEPGAS